MLLKFTKMHALGNDFVVIDAVRQDVSLSPQDACLIADRHFGVGCDQILLVEPPTNNGVDFGYRIINSDGSEVAQCGNGARCFAKFVRDQGLTDKTQILVATIHGRLELNVREDGQVTVDMGTPEFEPAKVPFAAPARATTYGLSVGDGVAEVSVLSLGNPHAVQIVPSVAEAPVATDGPIIEKHPRFPERVNAGFMEVVDADHIKLRVFERGAGETLACGSGACAAVIAGRQRGLLASAVTVDVAGGRLQVCWDGNGAPAYMTGPAASVFEGVMHLTTTNRKST